MFIPICSKPPKGMIFSLLLASFWLFLVGFLKGALFSPASFTAGKDLFVPCCLPLAGAALRFSSVFGSAVSLLPFSSFSSAITALGTLGTRLGLLFCGLLAIFVPSSRFSPVLFSVLFSVLVSGFTFSFTFSSKLKLIPPVYFSNSTSASFNNSSKMPITPSSSLSSSTNSNKASLSFSLDTSFKI